MILLSPKNETESNSSGINSDEIELNVKTPVLNFPFWKISF